MYYRYLDSQKNYFQIGQTKNELNDFFFRDLIEHTLLHYNNIFYKCNIQQQKELINQRKEVKQ